ncbi:MAG: hypothetical protein ABI651_17965 [Verrucomicrobiota bacterium]
MNSQQQLQSRPLLLLPCLLSICASQLAPVLFAVELGREVAITRHLQDGEEFSLPVRKLIEHGQKLFTANWTIEEGGGRPLTKGTGAALTDPSKPLVFPHNFNRVSAPDANSCAGCHNAPFGVAGGGGDIVANVFVLGQRFDFLTFDGIGLATENSLDELNFPVTLQTAANSRASLAMDARSPTWSTRGGGTTAAPSTW